MSKRYVCGLFIVVLAGCLLPTGCSQVTKSGKNKPDSLQAEQLRRQAVDTLRKGMHEGKEWVKVHAAEELIWNGYPQGVQETFQKELDKNPGEPYCIGVWRVLAYAAGKGTADYDRYEAKIYDIFLNPKSSFRIHAGETLGKLGYRHHIEEIAHIDADPNENKGSFRVMARWILANTGGEQEENRLTEFLDSKDTAVRNDIAYALRWLMTLNAKSLAKLDTEMANQQGTTVYFLSALYVHSPAAKAAEYKAKLLEYAKTGDKVDKNEVCYALALRGDVTDLDLLKKLMADKELDVRVNASNAILKILCKNLRLCSPKAD